MFDNISYVFFIAKMCEQDPNVKLTHDQYLKYLDIWNNLDEETKARYVFYVKNNIGIH